VFDERTVPMLRCRAVAGAANNQLAHDGVDRLLADRGILWVPDFVANAGGVINISVEFEEGGYSRERADARVRGVATTVRTILDHAEETRTTPLAAAMEIARRRVEEARGAIPAS
jgi:leucine dehydrogenase